MTYTYAKELLQRFLDSGDIIKFPVTLHGGNIHYSVSLHISFLEYCGGNNSAIWEYLGIPAVETGAICQALYEIPYTPTGSWPALNGSSPKQQRRIALTRAVYFLYKLCEYTANHSFNCFYEGDKEVIHGLIESTIKTFPYPDQISVILDTETMSLKNDVPASIPRIIQDKTPVKEDSIEFITTTQKSSPITTSSEYKPQAYLLNL
mgnify:CR=1 FL=1|jgi:hypothetical protein